jgi:hypothetical protein
MGQGVPLNSVIAKSSALRGDEAIQPLDLQLGALSLSKRLDRYGALRASRDAIYLEDTA